MKKIKAGCYLFNDENGKIALVYRPWHNDFSFPKGHLEYGESLQECAIRETLEETKRSCIILNEFPALVDHYIDSQNNKCACYMYIAKDLGESHCDNEEACEVIWTNLEEVEKKLTYDNLKPNWNIAHQLIKNNLSNNKRFNQENLN